MDFNEIINYNFDEKLIASINASKDLNLMHPSLNQLIELELNLFVYHFENLNKKERELVYLKFILPFEQEEVPFYAKGSIITNYDYSHCYYFFSFDLTKASIYLQYQNKFKVELSNQLSEIRRSYKIITLPSLTQIQKAFFFQLLNGSKLRPLKQKNINEHCEELCREFNYPYKKRIADNFNRAVEKYHKKKVIDKLLPKLPDDLKFPLNEFIKNEGEKLYSNSYYC
jgi:hypothetical protein